MGGGGGERACLPCCNLPHLDGLVSGAREQEVARRHEAHRGDVVVMALQRSDALVALSKVPQTYRHVR